MSLGWLGEALAGLSGLAMAPVPEEVQAGELIDAIRALESIKAAAAAAQARLSVAFDVAEQERQARLGVPAHRRGRGVAEQIALARRESPTRGSRHLGLAKALIQEMPHTWSAFACGELSEWRSTLIVQATAVLSREDRETVDVELAGQLDGLSDRQLAATARGAAYRVDPMAVVNARAVAEGDRRVSLRPTPEAMSILTAYLPMAQGIAAYAALERHVAAQRAAGDTRSRGQIAADTLVERLTGQATAGAVNIEVGLVITDAALLGAGTTPARIVGAGPLPAPAARALIRDTSGSVWVRRLLTSPVDGSVSEVERRRRLFTGHLRRTLIHRDQVCRTPWCGAPIRHLDHATAASRDGATSLDNGQGLCERCNYAKENPGWTTTTQPRTKEWPDITTPNKRDPVALSGEWEPDITFLQQLNLTTHVIQTPTGHRYRSTPPPAIPGTQLTPTEARARSQIQPMPA